MKNVIIKNENDIQINVNPILYEAVRNYVSSVLYPLESFYEDEETFTEEEKSMYIENKIRDMVFSLVRLFDLTRKELEGYFTEEEALFLVRIFYNNLYHVSEGIDPKIIINLMIDDSLKYESTSFTDEDFGIAKTLKEKIQNLTAFQAYTAIMLACSLKNKDNFTIEDVRQAFMAA